MDRNFKGIWIPKEIWLSEELSIQEKVLLVEIDSLDDEEIGCFASNKYFADFFNLSVRRIAQIIATLKGKGYLDISYKYKGKEIENRSIKINRPPYPEVVKIISVGGEENFSRVSNIFHGGNEKKCIDNNIYKNNINNNIKENNKKKYFEDEELDNLFKEYLSLRKKLKAVNSERAINTLLNKLEPYSDDEKKKMIDEAIVNSWKSVYPIKKERNNPKDFERPAWLDMDL